MVEVKGIFESYSLGQDTLRTTVSLGITDNLNATITNTTNEIISEIRLQQPGKMTLAVWPWQKQLLISQDKVIGNKTFLTIDTLIKDKLTFPPPLPTIKGKTSIGNKDDILFMANLQDRFGALTLKYWYAKNQMVSVSATTAGERSYKWKLRTKSNLLQTLGMRFNVGRGMLLTHKSSPLKNVVVKHSLDLASKEVGMGLRWSPKAQGPHSEISLALSMPMNMQGKPMGSINYNWIF